MRVLVAGLAVFAMFFGTGNLVFPLLLGVASEAAWPWALLGFGLADVFLSLLGMLVMLRFQGSPEQFFAPLGKRGQNILPWLLLLLMGPLVVMPRAISVAHGSLLSTGAEIPIWLFSALFLFVVWLANRRPGHMVDVVGKVFTPVKIILLTTIIGSCYWMARQLPAPEVAGLTSVEAFRTGINGGYETMDLIGVIFFGAVIARYFDAVQDPGRRFRQAFLATGIGMGLLLLCYLALCYLGGRYAAQLSALPATEMLPRIARLALGELSEEVTAATIIIANLTLSVALASVFASYCVEHVAACRERYGAVLLGVLVVDFCMSLFDFKAMLHYSDMVLALLYPLLIVVTGLNLFSLLRRSGRAGGTVT